jgi:hypothetical protein
MTNLSGGIFPHKNNRGHTIPMKRVIPLDTTKTMPEDLIAGGTSVRASGVSATHPRSRRHASKSDPGTSEMTSTPQPTRISTSRNVYSKVHTPTQVGAKR